jgi:hypothetical protein
VRKTVRYAVAQGLAAGLALTLPACGGDPEPRFEEEPSPTPSEVSSSAPATEAWEEKSPEGAVAFAEHWTATFSEAFQTGETDDLQALSAGQCGTCRTFIDLIREVYEGGGSIAGDPWSLRSPSWVESADSVVVTGKMQIPKQVISRAGEEPSEAEATRERYIFTIEWRDDAWQTTRLVRET